MLKCPHDEQDGNCSLCDPETAFYYKAYDLLIEHCGVRASYEPGKEVFTRYFIEEHGHEWRFQGSLGFGGKFWHRPSDWDINCYIEDMTPERRDTIKKVNLLLTELAKEIGVKP